jgi:hypothetical protein
MKTETSTIILVLRRTIFFISMPIFIVGLMLPLYGKAIGASIIQVG